MWREFDFPKAHKFETINKIVCQDWSPGTDEIDHKDNVPERLMGRPAKPVGIARVGSNPIVVEGLEIKNH